MAVIRRQSSRRDDTVNMGVQQQVLPPGMQNANQADVGAQVFRVCRHLQQGLCAGGEQQIVEQTLVVQRQHIEFVGNGEHDMEVVGGQQVLVPVRRASVRALVSGTSGSVGCGRYISLMGLGIGRWERNSWWFHLRSV